MKHTFKMNQIVRNSGREDDFSAKSYFESHDLRKWHRKAREPRILDAKQKKIFRAAMKMIRNGTSVSRAVAWAEKETRR